MMTKAYKTAFVIRIDTFAALFDNHADQLAALQRNGTHADSCLLILSSTAAQKSLPLFADEKGIFQRRVDGRPLFPEVICALEAENFYDRLQLQMGLRCAFLKLRRREWTVRSI